MSSNKIGFLTALGLYVPIILGLVWIDLRVNFVGEMGESKAFSIRLDNIGGDLERESLAKKAQKKVAKLAQKPQNRHSERSAESKPRESNAESSTDLKSESNAESSEFTAESSDSNSDSRGGVASRAQQSSGENDSYFLAITRIINKYHAKERINNLYGVVGVAFSVNVSGEVEDLRVISRSGSERLDSTALRTIRRAARSFPPPKRTYFIKTRLVYKKG